MVCGINNDRIQRRLLAEKDLTFDKALEVATAMEMAEKSAADLQGKAAMDMERSTVSVEKMTTELEGVNLVTEGIQLRDIECWFCHTKGHMQRDNVNSF